LIRAAHRAATSPRWTPAPPPAAPGPAW
jgi:hypothetical protein